MSTTVNVSDVDVSVSGSTIHVRIWKPESPETPIPVVLFHDSIGCVEMWREFPAILARDLARPVIAYDRLGYGRSSPCHSLPSVTFVTDEATANFPELKRQLKLDKFVAFGHSVGGAMAVIVATHFPEDCRAVITESAQAFVEPQTLVSIAEARVKFSSAPELAKLTRFHGDKARWVVDAWTETWLSSQFAEWNVRQELRDVRCPLLALHGELDEYGSVDFPKTLSSLTSGPAEQLIIPNCGHVPHREKPADVITAVREFLVRAQT